MLRTRTVSENGIGSKTQLLVLLVISTCAASNTAAFEYVLGDTNYPYDTSPTKPAKGSSFTDPRFKTTITRITNGVADGTGAAMVEYSTWNPLSSNGKYLLLMSDAGYAVWRAEAPYTFYKNVTSHLDWWNSQNAEGRWDLSGAHPTWIYYRKDRSLRRMDVETDEDVLVRDFTPELSAAGFGSSYYIYNGDEGACSDDSNVWAWIVKNESAPYNEPAILVWDKSANAVNIKNIAAYDGTNNVMVSPSGNYLYVAYNPSGSYVGEGRNPGIYSISAHATANSAQMFTSFRQSSAGVPHAAWGVSKQGHEGVVNLSPGGNQVDFLIFTRADNGAVYRLYYQGDMGWDGGGINHMTGPSLKPGWTFASTYDYVSTTGWAKAQIFAFELDETKYISMYASFNAASGTAGTQLPRIWRIAFEQNFIGENYYPQQPNAAIDKSGTRIWFGSNWRTQREQDMDVYQVTLPTTWWQDLTGSTPITAPSISTQPVNRAVTAGQTASFSISASGTAPLSYQWQKNGVNIAGASATSYTTPATTAADSGATFRCIVTNSAGSATSNAATLTVTSPANQPPQINSGPSAMPNPALAGQSATFVVAASDPEGASLSYSWDFGDGATGSGSSTTHIYANAGVYNVSVTVRDPQAASANASLSVSVIDPVVAGTGLRGEYFDNRDFTNLKKTRLDARINFNWGTGSPSFLTPNTFSVRWSGQVLPKYTENYTFYTLSDDGVRLWVNGQQIINNWTDHAAAENSGTIALVAGVKYDLRMEFYENRGNALARLSWSSTTQVKQVIPQSQLYPPRQAGAATSGTSATLEAAATGETAVIDLGSVKLGQYLRTILPLPEALQGFKRPKSAPAERAQLPSGLTLSGTRLRGKAIVAGVYEFGVLLQSVLKIKDQTGKRLSFEETSMVSYRLTVAP